MQMPTAQQASGDLSGLRMARDSRAKARFGNGAGDLTAPSGVVLSGLRAARASLSRSVLGSGNDADAGAGARLSGLQAARTGRDRAGVAVSAA